MTTVTDKDTSQDDRALLEELIKNSPFFKMPVPGSMVDGTVISLGKNKVLVDIDGMMTGIVSGKEAMDSLGTLKDLSPGDSITAYVIESENQEGLTVLSLRKASQEKTWGKFDAVYETGETISVTVNEANKGGLLLNVDGIKGFIPVSQLAPLHYPRVAGADANEILSRLEKLVGQKLDVKIINLDRDSGKLILSERAAQDGQRASSLTTLDVGAKVKGTISGIVNFGIFVAFEGLEGLVHISEIAWGHVKDPRDYGKLGQEVEVEVIGIEGEKISLSMKRLMPDPWSDVAKQFPINSMAKGPVTRITPFGVFMKLADDINGLIHISELSDEPNPDPSKLVKVGQVVEARIINVDLDEHRIGLSMKPESSIAPEAKPDAEAASEDPAKAAKTSSNEKTLQDLGLSDKIVATLEKGGIKTVEDLKKANEKTLTDLPGIGPATVKKLLATV